MPASPKRKVPARRKITKKTARKHKAVVAVPAKKTPTPFLQRRYDNAWIGAMECQEKIADQLGQQMNVQPDSFQFRAIAHEIARLSAVQAKHTDTMSLLRQKYEVAA